MKLFSFSSTSVERFSGLAGDFVFNCISSSTWDLCGDGTILYLNCVGGYINLRVQKNYIEPHHTHKLVHKKLKSE